MLLTLIAIFGTVGIDERGSKMAGMICLSMHIKRRYPWALSRSALEEDVGEEEKRVRESEFARRVYIALLGQLAADLTSWRSAKHLAALNRLI